MHLRACITRAHINYIYLKEDFLGFDTSYFVTCFPIVYNTWYHFQLIASLHRAATSHSQSIVYQQQTLTKRLKELNWKWYVCPAVSATRTVAIISVTHIQGQFILQDGSASFITEYSTCTLKPLLFSVETMTNSKTSYEEQESLLFFVWYLS